MEHQQLVVAGKGGVLVLFGIALLVRKTMADMKKAGPIVMCES